MPLYQGNRLRRGRFSEEGRLYLLTTVTADRAPLLADFSIGRLLVQEMRLAEEQQLLRSLCWVVMPDHLHWLIELGGVPLERIMQQVKSRSTKRINQLRCAEGPVWQKGFHDHALRRDEDVLVVARLLSPIHCVLAWSSVWAITRYGMPSGCKSGLGARAR